MELIKWEKEVKKNPMDYNAWLNLGIELTLNADDNAAYNAIARAVYLIPDHLSQMAKIMMERAVKFIRENYEQRTRAAFLSAMALKPNLKKMLQDYQEEYKKRSET